MPKETELTKCNLCGVRCENLPEAPGRFKFITIDDTKPEYKPESIEECPIVRSLVDKNEK